MQSFTVCVMIGVSTDIFLFFLSVFICVLFTFFLFVLFVYYVYDFRNNNNNATSKVEMCHTL